MEKTCLSTWRGSQIHRKRGSNARAGLIANQMHCIERMKKNQRSCLSDLPKAGHVGQTKSCLYSNGRTLFSFMYLLKKEGPLFWLPLSNPGCPWNRQSSCISFVSVDPSYLAFTMFLTIKHNGESEQSSSYPCIHCDSRTDEAKQYDLELEWRWKRW